MALANINGNLTEQTEPFHFLDGFYESILLLDGSIQLKQLHQERLRRGLNTFGFHDSDFAETFESEILKTTAANNLKQSMVRLQISPAQHGFDFFIECTPVSDDRVRYNETGLHLGIADWLQKNSSKISALKIPGVKAIWDARKLAEEYKLDDVLVTNASGNIVESGIANVFWIRNGTVCTPPLSEGCIGGVMRTHLLQSLPELGYRTEEKSLSIPELLAADEVFLSNAVRRIKWVRQIHDTVFPHAQSHDIYLKLFGATPLA